jgi:ribosome-associated heat shock protein Hsp15
MNEDARSTELPQLRLDKWLWAARFYKTRSMAAKAVSTGKVLLHGNRSKPAKLIQIGDALIVERGPLQYEITIEGLNDKRRPPPEARQLYRESDASIKKREEVAAQLKAEGLIYLKVPNPGRPTKKQRRQIVNLKTGGLSDEEEPTQRR